MNDDIKFLNIEWRTRYSLPNFEDHFGFYGSAIFFRPKNVWFLAHLYIALLIPNSSGQLAKLIVHIIPLE